MAERQSGELELGIESASTPPLDTLTGKQSQDFKRVYGSIVAITSNAFDISLTFGQTIADIGDPYIEQRVTVTMPWQGAKAMAQLLLATIGSYERQLGEIRLPNPRPDQSASE